MRRLDEIESPPELTDGRLRLRALQPADKAAVVAALNDELAAHFLWKPPYPYTESDFDEWLGIAGRSWQSQRMANWVITLADEDESAADSRRPPAPAPWRGAISIAVVEDREAGEIGYHVGPWARGQGLAAAAVRLVRDWALDELGLERLEIHADIENVRSQRVAMAAGFRFEGVLRGHLTARGTRRDDCCFGFVPSDPRAPLVPLPRPDLGDGRIVVRPFVPDDAPAVAAACQDPLIQARCYFVPSPYRIEDAQRFIKQAEWDLLRGTDVHCAVCDATTGELLGAIDLVTFPEREAAETGYWVKREARGRGVATAALCLVIRYAFEQVGVERLELMTETPNLASQRLAEKLGFTREGLLRAYLASRGERDRDLVEPAHGRIDQVLFSLLRPEWEALRRAGGTKALGVWIERHGSPKPA